MRMGTDGSRSARPDGRDSRWTVPVGRVSGVLIMHHMVYAHRSVRRTPRQGGPSLARGSRALQSNGSYYNSACCAYQVMVPITLSSSSNEAAGWGVSSVG